MSLALVDAGHRKERFRIFGHTSNVTTSFRVVGDSIATVPNLPTSAQSVEILCANAADTAAGSGARTVRLYGLDANWKPQVEEVTLATTPAVATSANTWLRVLRAAVSTAGTADSNNTGLITVRIASAGATFLTIEAGYGESENGHFCTAEEQTLFLEDIHFTTDGNKAMDFELWTIERADGSSFQNIKRIEQRYEGISGAVDWSYPNEIRIPEKTDIWATVKVATSGSATVEFAGILTSSR